MTEQQKYGNEKVLICESDMTLLWLDDLRDPILDLEKKVPKINFKTIVWVKCFESFTEWIEKNGLPDVISFDHDLAFEHYTPECFWNNYQLSKEYQDSQNYKEKTGLDCAKWLCDYCLRNSLTLPKYYIHSANPVGADNINNYLYNYKKHSE